MRVYKDRKHEGNSEKYHTGKKCIECDNKAGTRWSPLWCVDCNIRRMDRITAQLENMIQDDNW